MSGSKLGKAGESRACELRNEAPEFESDESCTVEVRERGGLDT